MPCPCCGGELAGCVNLCSYHIIADFGIDSWDYKCADATLPASLQWDAAGGQGLWSHQTAADDVSGAPGFAWGAAVSGASPFLETRGGIVPCWVNPLTGINECGFTYFYRNYVCGGIQGAPLIYRSYEQLYGLLSSPYENEQPDSKSYLLQCQAEITPCLDNQFRDCEDTGCGPPVEWSIKAFYQQRYIEVTGGVYSSNEIYRATTTFKPMWRQGCELNQRRASQQPSKAFCYAASAGPCGDKYPDFHIPNPMTVLIDKTGIHFTSGQGMVQWDAAESYDEGTLPAEAELTYGFTIAQEGSCCFTDCDGTTDNCCSNPLP